MDLGHRSRHILRPGVGHGLDCDRRAAADADPADLYGSGMLPVEICLKSLPIFHVFTHMLLLNYTPYLNIRLCDPKKHLPHARQMLHLVCLFSYHTTFGGSWLDAAICFYDMLLTFALTNNIIGRRSSFSIPGIPNISSGGCASSTASRSKPLSNRPINICVNDQRANAAAFRLFHRSSPDQPPR